MNQPSLKSRLKVYVRQLLADDDNAIRHFVQVNDIDDLLDASSDNEEEFVKEQVNILTDQPVWNDIMWLVYQYTHSVNEQRRLKLLAKIFILGEMSRTNEHC